MKYLFTMLLTMAIYGCSLIPIAEQAGERVIEDVVQGEKDRSSGPSKA
jgi:hypothetical protein